MLNNNRREEYMFLNPEKIKKDIVQMEKLKTRTNFNFSYLNKGTSYVGMIIVPTDQEGNPVDFYHIDNVHRFGKNYIAQNEHNDQIISTIDGLGDTVNLSKTLNDYAKTYSLISNIKFGIIDPTDKKNLLKIVVISYSTNISEFLSKFYELYNKVQDSVFNRLIKVKMTQAGDIELEVSEPKDFTWERIVKEKLGEDQISFISSNLNKLITSSKEFEETELTTMLMKWKREVDHEFENEPVNISSDKVVTNGWDQFVNKRSESQNEEKNDEVEIITENDNDISDDPDDIWGDFETTTKYEPSPF